MMTVMGSTPGARTGSWFNSKLLKTDCPVPKEVEVPTQKETERAVSVSVSGTTRCKRIGADQKPR